MKTIRIFLSIAMIVIIAGCERQKPPVAAQPAVEPAVQVSEAAPEQTALSFFKKVKKNTIKPFEVKLKVEQDSTTNTWTLDNKKLNVNNPQCTKNWNDNDLKGCIDGQKNEMVNVNFKLIGSPGWYFSEFQICAVQNLQKPDFNNCTLTAEQAGEWIILAGGEAAIPDENDHGRVVISNLVQDLSQFTLIDVNLTVKDYFYLVCAKNANGNVACSDPAAENYGNG